MSLLTRLLKLTHDVAASAALIGTSNFFELAVAVAISLFGLGSGATLATVVGVASGERSGEDVWAVASGMKRQRA